MAGRHMQIERPDFQIGRQLFDNHWLRINDRRRWCIAEVDFPIDARADFTADTDVDNRQFRMG